MTPDTAALRALAADAPTGTPRAVRIAATIGNASTGVESAHLVGIDVGTVRALCDAADEVERLRAVPEPDNHHNAYACPYCEAPIRAVEAERDASRTAHAALVADLRALHRPGIPDREGKAECKECFDTWPCRTATAHDRHAPEEGS